MNSTKNIFSLTHLDYICSDSRVVPHAGLVIPGQILDAIGFDKAVNKSTPVTKEYKNSEILKSILICILCGNADYDSIHETDDDQEYYCNAMRMTKIPSEATMRQRMDDINQFQSSAFNKQRRGISSVLFYHIPTKMSIVLLVSI